MKLRLPAPHVGRLSANSGLASASTKIGWLRDQSSRYSRKSSRPASAHCTSSKTSTVGDSSASRSKRIRQAEKRFSWSPATPSSSPSRWARRGSTHARSSASRMYSDSESRSLSRAVAGSSSSAMPQRILHHLRKCPVGDPVPVREAAAAMPERLAGEPVDVFLELPRQPRLADPGDPVDEHELRAALVGGGVEELLDESQLAVPTDERRFEAGRAERASRSGDDAERTPQLDRLGLALERVQAGVVVGHGGLGRPLRRLADEHGPGLGRALDPRGRVDEIPCDHALALRAECDRGLAAQHAPARLQGRIERGHRGEQLECRPHGPLRVVLLRDRRAPERHHRVADELLDRAAVALNRRPRKVEVAREELSRLLGIPRLGRGGEADEVDEEHGDEPAFGDRRRRALGRRVERERRAALAAELRLRSVGAAAGRACRRQRGAAIAAELATRLVRGTAVAAVRHVRTVGEGPAGVQTSTLPP